MLGFREQMRDKIKMRKKMYTLVIKSTIKVTIETPKAFRVYVSKLHHELYMYLFINFAT